MRSFKNSASRRGHTRQNRRRPLKGNRRPRQLETLENRMLLASVVLEESTFDPAAFSTNVSAYLDFNTVGFAHAVNHNGVATVSSGTGGIFGPGDGRAVMMVDTGPGELPIAFETDTRVEVASISKMITTTAVLQLLENRVAKGEFESLEIAVNTPISQYLPGNWSMGNNVDLVTVRHLLTHTSGFNEQPASPANPLGNSIGVDFNSFGNNTFTNLGQLVASNLPAPGPLGSWPYSYNNANFSLLVKMLPYLQGGNDAFWDVMSNSPFADQLFGIFHEAYVQARILEPSGIVDASLDVPATNPAIGYNYPGNTAGLPQVDFTDLGGAFGWKLSRSRCSPTNCNTVRSSRMTLVN